jgi:peptidoglycan-associated lipoprotein
MTRIARFTPTLALTALVLATTTACPKRTETTPAPVNADSLAREQARRDSIARADAARAEADRLARARQDSIANAERMRTEALNAARAALTAVIYFEYDQSEITAESRSRLDAKLPILQANTAMTIRVAGHTDERGSDEYNLALGQRRAAAAKRYLVQNGIADGRITIQSFGEEQPAAQGSDESAWSQNRRAEFEITAGGDNITVPQQ